MRGYSLSLSKTVRVASCCLATVHEARGVPGFRLWPSHAKSGLINSARTASMSGCANGMRGSASLAPGSTPDQKML